jgi:leucyl aminopeptidase
MKHSIKAGGVDKINSECIAVVVWNKGILSEEAQLSDQLSGKVISKIIHSEDFTGKLGQTYIAYNPSGIKSKRLLLLGGGDSKKFDAKNGAKMLAAGLRAVFKTNASNVHFALASIKLQHGAPTWLYQRLTQAAETSSYRYTETKSKKAKAISTKLLTVSPVKGLPKKSLEIALKTGHAIGSGINRARHLGNLPGNICTPSYLAKEAKNLGEKYSNLKVKILGEKQMQRLKMGSLLSVSAGSAEEAKLIVMEYKGAKATSKPYVLVGKGVTFDTGGISLKPGAAMDEMKFDMCGAASVVGTMAAVAQLKLPINIVGLVGAVENMPSGTATKPGDIVTSMAGKTIEVLNTDAEGRLVLCDMLTYTERYQPRSVIDIATLTGAAVATFGSHVSAMLSNDDKLSDSLIECGKNSLDPVWPLPLWEEYQSQLHSNFADIANIGGPRAGTITAACFLSRFTEKYKWAHLDIAGSAWDSGPQKGATGRPVALLVEYLSQQKA